MCNKQLEFTGKVVLGLFKVVNCLDRIENNWQNINLGFPDNRFPIFYWIHNYFLLTCFIVSFRTIRSGPGDAQWLRHGANIREAPGSIPGGVTENFFRDILDRTMCLEVDSATESEYQGFLLG